MNVDIAFLTNSAQRMLSGMPMMDGYIDTNPPLSIIIYAPLAWFTNLSNIPLYFGIYIYAGAFLVLSCCLLYALLSRLSWCQREDKILFVSIFFAANLLISGYEFGQRDHLLFIACMPLFITQVMMTYATKIPTPIKWISIIWGAVFILLKPHYGIIPAAIFIHRALIQRRLSIIKDDDFLALALAFFAYIGVLYVFFPDFLFVVMPDVMTFYLRPPQNSIILDTALFAAIGAAVMIAACLCPKQSNMNTISSTLALLSIFCLVPYYTQGHGFYYHLIATKISLLMAVAFLVYSLFRHFNINLKISSLIVLLMSVAFLNSTQTILAKPERHSYHETALFKEIDICTHQDCSFFMYHGSISIIHELAVYTDQDHASRFSSFWFIPYFVGYNWGEDDQKLHDTVQRYINYIGDDINRWKPETILIGRYKVKGHHIYNDKFFDLISEFSQRSDDFSNIMSGYRLEKTIMIQRTDYTGEYYSTKEEAPAIPFDIYRRNK